MSLTSIFTTAVAAVASCTFVHIGFGIFGAEALLHGIGEQFELLNLGELFGFEGGHGHAHGGAAGVSDVAIESLDLHDHGPECAH